MKFLSLAFSILFSISLAAKDYQPETTQGEIWNERQEQLMEKTFNLMKKKLMHPERQNVRRAVHPKAHGCVRAKLEIDNSRLPAEYQVGMFSISNSYETLIRFSDGSPILWSHDLVPDARGMAVKVKNVPYNNYFNRVGAEEATSDHDLVFINSSNFFLNDNEGYVQLLEGLTNPLKLISFGVNHPKSIAIALKMATQPVSNPLFINYHSSTAYKLGNTSMKMMFKTCSDKDRNILELAGRLHPNYLRKRLKNSVQTKEHCFTFHIQPNQDIKHNSVEKPMEDWRTTHSPYVQVGRLTIPKQNNWQEFNSGRRCQDTSFNPWRAPEENRPMGSINRARLEIYLKMAELRRQNK